MVSRLLNLNVHFHIVAAQQELEAEMESQVVADERVATHLQRVENQKSKGFQRDHELAKRLEVSFPILRIWDNS